MASSMTSTEIEVATIRAFVLKGKQERFVNFLANPKHRRKFTRELAHFRGLDPRFATPVPWKVDPKLELRQRGAQGIGNIVHLLESRGAEKTCWVISENSRLDGREMDLADALEEVVGRGMGTILCCVPGKLAYFEDEDQSLLLAR
jgi:hypothetical protein